MKKLMMLVASSFILSGCGDDNEIKVNTNKPEEVQEYRIKTVLTSSNGVISPSESIVKHGETVDFYITPNPAYYIENVEGCGGTLNGHTYTTGVLTDDCTISVSFISDVDQALKYADHELATESSLLKTASATIENIKISRSTELPKFFEGVNNLTWDPSHDSINFHQFANIENTDVLLRANADHSGNQADKVLALYRIGKNGDRSIVSGANILALAESGTAGSDFNLFAKNVVEWLAGRKIEGTRKRLPVVTSHIPNSRPYFEHYPKIKAWLEKNYPGQYLLNEHRACDYGNLVACIQTQSPDLVLIGGDDYEQKGYAGIRDAIRYMEQHNIPYMTSHNSKFPSDQPMLEEFYQEQMIFGDTNYWGKYRLNNATRDVLITETPLYNSISQLLEAFEQEHFDAEALKACGSNFITCNSDLFNNAFKTAADWFRWAAQAADQQNLDPFKTDNHLLLKLGLLLADKYRAAIDYPIEITNVAEWYRAMFADWVISYSRADNRAQPDLGEFVTDRSNLEKGINAHYRYPETVTERKTISVMYPNQWTTTGWYALPGQTITLKRLDHGNHQVKVKLNYHRYNTNRAYEQHVYRGPLEILSERISIPAGGSATLSTPYGGPIYLSFYKNGAGEALTTEIEASGVAKHPTIMDFSDEKQHVEFERRLQETELPHVDLRTDSAEQHLRRDRFEGAIGKEYVSTSALLTGIREDHLETVYNLAGFKVQGKTLDESLSPQVVAACKSVMGEDCVDDSLHVRAIIQHANYDQNAHCGVGCSGNPWDSSGRISPTGWLDNHELGHNLQTGKLNVHYVPAGSENTWSAYQNRAGENSNNIFPYVSLWRKHYIRDGQVTKIEDGHMNHKDLFFAFMSDAVEVKDKSGKRVVLYPGCKVADAGESRYEALWANGGYAVHNSPRMAFYIQMALRAHGMTLRDGSTLKNGFDIFTILYLHQRIFDKYTGNEAIWNENRDRLGFSKFDYKSTLGEVKHMPGNDFMLVTLSYYTGYDWTPHFDLLGLRYSSLAKEQAVQHGIKGKLKMGMYVLEKDLPPHNMSNGLTFIDMSLTDKTTKWPRDNSTPLDCKLTY
ncbi:ImpA family metalloprotease [Vibrio cholerae]|uniref:ImpA family metalloprotease n=1 Tax=Vibrio cholerae TaxID=666 RepID=UPI00061557BB|nr:ImpA family metalloprotease [Vibrio cholerae]AKB06061.1 peptidase M60-like family protein [Vibrio cholerae]